MDSRPRGCVLYCEAWTGLAVLYRSHDAAATLWAYNRPDRETARRVRSVTYERRHTTTLAARGGIRTRAVVVPLPAAFRAAGHARDRAAVTVRYSPTGSPAPVPGARFTVPTATLALLSVAIILLVALMSGGNPLRSTGASAAAIVVSPDTATPGGTLRVSASGLASSISGTLVLDGAPYEQLQTSASGAFSVLIQLPAGTAAGPHVVGFVTDRPLATATFRVEDQAPVARTSVPTPPPMAAMPTSVPPAAVPSTPIAGPPSAGLATTPTVLPTSTLAPENGLALGVFLAGSPEDVGRIDRYTALVGKPPAVLMWYHDWAHGGFNKGIMDGIAARGVTPMVTWEPWDYTAGIVQPAYALRTIASGTYDDYIRQYARDSAAWGQPYYLRFAHEMNGDWYPWGRGISGNTPADFIAAWRRVHDIFQQEGATNVRWVWSPNVADPNSTPFAELYPGDAYVDWVGVVGYNWGASYSWSGWVSFAALFGPSYAQLITLTQKPLMITEVGSSETGGDKASWILQGLLNDLPLRFPRVRAVLWFNANQEADWAITTSPAALEAFRRVVGSPLYQNRLP